MFFLYRTRVSFINELKVFQNGIRRNFKTKKKLHVFLKLKLYVESAHGSKVTMFRF